MLGLREGLLEGRKIGFLVGFEVKEGLLEGTEVNFALLIGRLEVTLGDDVGTELGVIVGAAVGDTLGVALGLALGDTKLCTYIVT